MKRHRFFTQIPILLRQTIKIDDTKLTHQVRDVLHLQKGERIVLFDGSGAETEVELVEVTRAHIIVKGLINIHEKNENMVRVTLYCAVLKKENLELVVQKATEVGVSTIKPIITARTIKLGLRIDRLQKIITEAAEQSGRTQIPELYDPISFIDALGELGTTKGIFCDISGELFPEISGQNISLFIGPEGGWEERELLEARSAGCVIASLGSLVLRAETSAIIASYLAVRKDT